ncbi:MAG: flagellar motor protein [Planctomycetes bacterium]|nr:flagellar motor protein [Planctomycetota bacterium]
MDIFSLIGVILGVLAVFGGAVLEGIHIGAILIPTAAIIVFGGTIGAVCLQSSAEEMKAVKAMLPRVFKPAQADAGGLVKDILELSKIARRDGMLALETKLQEIKNPFLVQALGLLIDGVASAELRSRLETAMAKGEEKYADAARVFEGAGGYSPTVGILGAVLGLIHVMGNLDDPSKLGSGIATASVATIYGVGLANLVCLPLAGKLKSRARAETARAEVVVEGVVGMADGQPTSALEQTLKILLGREEKQPAQGEEAAKAA